jgi:hypothetical protein
MSGRDDHLDSLNWALDQLQHHAASVAHHHEQLRTCLDFADRWTTKAIARAHALGDADLAERLRKADDARCAAADMVDDVSEHVAALARHVDKARARADELDGGAKAALRRREKQIAATRYRMAATDAVMEARYPAPLASFKVLDPSRQVEAVLAASAAGIDLSEYKTRRGVLLKHGGEPIAWCCSIGADYAGRLVGVANFPPKGVSARGDRVFEQIRNGKLKAASVSLSIIDKRTGEASLREWSFVPAGADPEAKVLSIGGESVGAPDHLSHYGIDNARAQAKRFESWRMGLN